VDELSLLVHPCVAGAAGHGTELPQRGARTLAGLVFSTVGRRPASDDVVALGPVRLTVEKVDGVRIRQLRVELPECGETRATDEDA
jgi:CBS domain containing-hemolysin-like protein